MNTPKGFLIDMDGVIYKGSQILPGADRFIAMLRERGYPFRFLTNNSQRTCRDVAMKLQRMGIDAYEEDIYTCAMATATFLARQKPRGTASLSVAPHRLPTRELVIVGLAELPSLGSYNESPKTLRMAPVSLNFELLDWLP